MSTEIQGINRRSLAKGAAWAAPAVLATAMIPAYAASRLDRITASRSGGITFTYPYTATRDSEGKITSRTFSNFTTRWFGQSAGSIWVNNIPQSLKVAKIETTVWIESRSDLSRGTRGIPPLVQPVTRLGTRHQSVTAARYFENYMSNAGNFTRITNNATSGTFADFKNRNLTNDWTYFPPTQKYDPYLNTSYNAWGLKIDWDRAKGDQRNATIQETTPVGGVYNFYLPEMGELLALYYNVVRNTERVEQAHDFVEVKITFDDGSTLEFTQKAGSFTLDKKVFNQS